MRHIGIDPEYGNIIPFVRTLTSIACFIAREFEELYLWKKANEG